jgi:plastocyanin
VAVVLVALSVSACSSGSSVPNAHVAGPTNGHVDAVVMLKDVSFEPQLVTIHVGQAVEWIWEDAPVAHNVTFTNFASPTQATGTFIHTFTRPGTFPYRCTIHSDMTGTVAVVP